MDMDVGGISESESVGDENDLEIILDGDPPDTTEQQADDEEINLATNDEIQENTEGDSKKVKPKRVVKNPQPKLNEQTLKGPRGLAAIESYFDRVKFKGRGFEEQDLNVLLKTYEYWCHRLFPKFPFDSCIARLEKLGTKRATLTQIKRIRMGLNVDEPENEILNDEEENDTGGFVDTYNDQFDDLASTIQPVPEISEEQLERMRQNMERAKRLREEKLKKIRENAQNNFEVHNPVNTQNTENFEIGSITNVSSDNNINICGIQSEDPESFQFNSVTDETNDQSNNQNIVKEVQQTYQIEGKFDSEDHIEDNDDDIDNILDFINAEDSNENTGNAKQSNKQSFNDETSKNCSKRIDKNLDNKTSNSSTLEGDDTGKQFATIDRENNSSEIRCILTTDEKGSNILTQTLSNVGQECYPKLVVSTADSNDVNMKTDELGT